MFQEVPVVPKASFYWVPIVLFALGTALGTEPLEPGGTSGTHGTADAPPRFVVKLETTKGAILIECFRDWAPLGADRFHELVTGGYYDDAALFRIRPKTWVQFGINGDPKDAQAWRPRTIADDPFQPAHPNERGTIFFAWAVPNGRTTQVVINLRDNREAHDKEPFVPFGHVIEGMEIADSLFDEYGEAAGGGIRAGKQDPVFQGGNAYLRKNFPKLDYIKTARVIDKR
jgi:cyclophilin family peptidyl-prolyl cis-trans isomerase